MTYGQTYTAYRDHTRDVYLRWIKGRRGLAALLVAAIFVAATRHVAPLMRWPSDLTIPFDGWLNGILNSIAGLDSFGGLTVRDATRAVGAVIAQPAEFLRALLATGFTRGFGEQQVMVFPSISWLSLVLIIIIACYRKGGAGLAAFAAMTCLYLLVFGLWASTITTLAQLAVAVPLSLLLGFSVGLLVFRFRSLEGVVFAVLNQMQTIPLFAYLVPIIMFFGIGTTAGILAVVIFAAPPMVRATVFGLAEAKAQYAELAAAVGATPAQALWKILLPAAQTSLRLGLNQVIMLAFATVILAALVGAQGIGYEVLTALQRLAIGRGLVAGLAITLTAILFDQFLQSKGSPRFSGRWIIGIAVVVTLIPWLLSSKFPQLDAYPRAWTVTTTRGIDDLVDFIIQISYVPISFVQSVLVVLVFSPLKALLLGLPWFSVAAGVFMLSWRTASLTRAFVLGGLVALIAATGFWDRAVLTFYLCFAGSIIAMLVGFPLGILSARKPKVGRFILPLADTFQTLPAFIYLIPVIMLFGSGDVPCIVAIAIFAACPAIRYTAAALLSLPTSLVEVGVQIGATPWQRLTIIELPAALPGILLTIAQVALMALAMVVVTALIGTTDLGQLILLSISKANSGQALMAGICVAIIGVVVDGLLTDKANQINARRRST